jgi:D-tyrosyl-tRNA(Tyr) deacylase
MLYRRKNHGVRAVVQRVLEASVTVGDDVVAASGGGVLVLLGVEATDTAKTSKALARKVARLRIFDNDDGRFDRSLLDVGGHALVVSQFTLIADTTRGNRPSFTDAAAPDLAEPLYEAFCTALAAAGVPVARGVFGARMCVSLVNDGPVTILLEARALWGTTGRAVLSFLHHISPVLEKWAPGAHFL